MLEAMATLILVIVGAVLIIFVVGYGIYITFYPLTKTVKGGIDAMKEYAEEEEKGTANTRDDRSRKKDHRGTQKKEHKQKNREI